ncbi:hypothetical protein [Ereboglobus sp. PH5-5]|uniref:hypothetical protein n=1 Tax=Ereboglobus sp. PH5-5 TaxID=2940529 RepID=UPI00240651E6|nr:hypothetical protein [Ereboglobus sp. PH5-5]
MLYELIEDIEQVGQVVLSHPAKNRIIAETMHKNDRFDAHALATLLRDELISLMLVPAEVVSIDTKPSEAARKEIKALPAIKMAKFVQL